MNLSALCIYREKYDIVIKLMDKTIVKNETSVCGLN